MSYVNLLVKIESEINDTVFKIQQATKAPVAVSYEIQELINKKKVLEKLAYEYVHLEGRFKELAGLNSVY